MRVFHICFLFLITTSGWTQPRLILDHLDLADGLIDLDISSIYQDSVGFIWFGTPTGLSRYDGRQMKNYSYDPEYPQYNYPETAYQISEDHKGQMWVLEDLLGGLSAYFPGQDTFLTYLQNEGIRTSCFYPDSAGRMWIGTLDQGILLLDLESGEAQSFSELFDLNLNPIHVSTIFEDSFGHLWFSDPGGIYQFTWTDTSLVYHPFRKKQGRTLSDQVISTQVFQDSKKGLWVGSEFGLYKFDEKLNKFSLFPLRDSSGKQEPAIRAIAETHDGKLCLGTEEDGLFALDPEAGLVENYLAIPGDPTSLRSNYISSLYCDRDGNLWIGTFGKGVSFWGKHRKPFFSYRNNTTLASSFVANSATDFSEKPNGNIWIAGDGTLDLFDPKTNTFNHGFSQIRAYCLVQDNSRILWTGDWGTGLHSLNPDLKRGTTFQANADLPGSLPGNEISEIFIDREGRIFLGVWGKSLLRFFPEQGAFLPIPLIHPQKEDTIGLYIQHIYEDKSGHKWIGTYYEVIQLDEHGEVLNVFDIPTYMIHQAQNGQIWLASKLGLYELNPETGQYKLWRKKEGLPHHIVYSILEDEHGGLWLGTHQGLAHLDIETGHIRSFNSNDGLPGSRFFRGAAYKTSTGELYFGAYDGLLRFHPDSIKQNLQIPPIVLTDFRIGGKSIPIRESLSDTFDLESPLVEQIVYARNIRLNWRQNDLFFEFASLNYQNPENNQYQYFLENYDEDWQSASAYNPSANYTNLNPGHYTFRVIGANNDGVWNREGVSLKITITPPLWQTWIAYIFYTLIVAGMGYGFFRWRTNSLRKQRQLLRTRVYEQTQKMRAEQQRSDELLLNILPAAVAHELKATGKTEPVFFEEVSIMFADFKGFTNIVASIPGKKLVSELDDIFQAYDEIMEEVGLEKIQTVGDAYLAACGLPDSDPDHAKKCVIAAQKIIVFLEERNQTEGIKWNVRIGIHSGSITAGVIGKKKFAYDLFGDTINIAARIESASESGKINVSAYTYTLIKEDFPCEYRGKINAKGKGELDMYFVD